MGKSIGTIAFVVVMLILVVSWALFPVTPDPNNPGYTEPPPITIGFAKIWGIVDNVSGFAKSSMDAVRSIFRALNNEDVPFEEFGADGSTNGVSNPYIRSLFSDLQIGSRQIVYLGRHSWFYRTQNLFSFEVKNENGSVTTYYFRVVYKDNVYEVYYLDTAYSGETWRKDGTYLFESAMYGEDQPFAPDRVIDRSQNGYG